MRKNISIVLVFIAIVAFTAGCATELDNGENLFVFSQNGQKGYMNKTGKIIADAQFDEALDFVEGAARVGNHTDDWKNGNAVADSGISYTRWGFIDVKGKLITPLKYSYVWDFSEGLALVKEVDDSSYYIDKKGKKSQQKNIGSEFFTEGFSPKQIRGEEFWGGPPLPDSSLVVWSYINSNGELATDKEFEEAGYFSDGLAIVKNNGKYGVINTAFNIVIDCKYDNLYEADVDLFTAKVGDKWGLIDSTDKVIADFIYGNIAPFSEGLAPVSTFRTHYTKK